MPCVICYEAIHMEYEDRYDVLTEKGYAGINNANQHI